MIGAEKRQERERQKRYFIEAFTELHEEHGPYAWFRPSTVSEHAMTKDEVFIAKQALRNDVLSILNLGMHRPRVQDYPSQRAGSVGLLEVLCQEGLVQKELEYFAMNFRTGSAIVHYNPPEPRLYMYRLDPIPA